MRFIPLTNVSHHRVKRETFGETWRSFGTVPDGRRVSARVTLPTAVATHPELRHAHLDRAVHTEAARLIAKEDQAVRIWIIKLVVLLALAFYLVHLITS